MDFSSIEAELAGLLESLAGVLTAAERAEVDEFVAHREYGVALETLIAILVEEQKTPPDESLAVMASLAKSMHMPADVIPHELTRLAQQGRGDLDVDEAEWPFADPENVAVYTIRQVLDGAWVRSVFHDAEDGAWQFFSSHGAIEEDGCLVSLKNMVTLDASIRELADLPLGWCAWRETSESPWIRQPRPTDPEDG